MAGSRRIAPLFAGAAPILAALVVFKLFFAPPNDIIREQSIGRVLSKVQNVHRIEIVATAVGKELWFGRASHVGVLPILAMFVLAVGIRRPVPIGPMLGLTCAGTLIAADIVVYIVTPHDLAWQLRTSLDRVIVQVFPAIVWCGMSLARVRAGEPRSRPAHLVSDPTGLEEEVIHLLKLARSARGGAAVGGALDVLPPHANRGRPRAGRIVVRIEGGRHVHPARREHRPRELLEEFVPLAVLRVDPHARVAVAQELTRGQAVDTSAGNIVPLELIISRLTSSGQNLKRSVDRMNSGAAMASSTARSAATSDRFLTSAVSRTQRSATHIAG